jgi:hypothetical protein
LVKDCLRSRSRDGARSFWDARIVAGCRVPARTGALYYHPADELLQQALVVTWNWWPLYTRKAADFADLEELMTIVAI